MPLKNVLRRVFGAPKEIEFQLLQRSGSAVELHYYNRNVHRQRARFLPRYYSEHDDMAAHNSRNTADELRVLTRAEMQSAALTVVFVHFEPADGFPAPLAHIPEEVADDELRLFDPLLRDASLDGALASCHLFKQRADLREAVLLKCVEPKAAFPYIHYAVFRALDATGTGFSRGLRRHSGNIANCKHVIGAYEELGSVAKSSSSFDSRLPRGRHTGYVMLEYRVLDAGPTDVLDGSWLSWSGAREVYKCCPRSWDLRRITLHRGSPRSPTPAGATGGGAALPFAYVLLCEFANVLHPSNLLHGCELVERLRVRHCGHVGLYRVQWTHANSQQAQPTDVLPVAAPTSAKQSVVAEHCPESKSEMLVA